MVQMKPDPATTGKAKRMVDRLRAHHALGRQANESQLSTREFADKHGYNEHTMRKIRAFAREYDANGLDRLCALRRPNGLPLQWGHIPYLLTIKDRRQRLRIQERAAREGWTAPILNAAIPSKFRSAAGHGRTMHRPATAVDGLRQLKTQSEIWLRRCSVNMEAVRAEVAGKHAGSDFRALTAELADVLDRIEKLAQSTRKELRRSVPRSSGNL